MAFVLWEDDDLVSVPSTPAPIHRQVPRYGQGAGGAMERVPKTRIPHLLIGSTPLVRTVLTPCYAPARRQDEINANYGGGAVPSPASPPRASGGVISASAPLRQ